MCDKGITVLVFWRLYNECLIYADIIEKLNELEGQIQSSQYTEVLAYNPQSDKKVTLYQRKIAWKIPPDH